MNTTSSSIRVGIVGLGRAGVNIHLSAIKKNSRFTLTAVSDPLPGRAADIAAQEGNGVAAFLSLPELLASDRCDLVIIATPSNTHFADAKAVLEAGIDCLLEKPMAANGADAAALVDLATQLGRRLFVHHQYVVSDELLFLQEVIRSGKLGEVFHLDIFWTGYARRWDWQTLRKNNGGQLLNTCPHLVSELLPLLGGDLEITAADVRLLKDSGDTEDYVHFHAKGKNGITASATVSSVCALPMPRLTMLGSRGTLQENYFEATLRYYDPAAVPVREVIDAAAPTDNSLKEELPWVEEKLPVCPSEPVSSFHDHVAAVLLDGAPLLASPREAARVTAILETISKMGR